MFRSKLSHLTILAVLVLDLPTCTSYMFHAPGQTLEIVLFHQWSSCVEQSASWPADTRHFAGLL